MKAKKVNEDNIFKGKSIDDILKTSSLDEILIGGIKEDNLFMVNFALERGCNLLWVQNQIPVFPDIVKSVIKVTGAEAIQNKKMKYHLSQPKDTLKIFFKYVYGDSVGKKSNTKYFNYVPINDSFISNLNLGIKNIERIKKFINNESLPQI